jgi:hypothetical protein
MTKLHTCTSVNDLKKRITTAEDILRVFGTNQVIEFISVTWQKLTHKTFVTSLTKTSRHILNTK